MITYAEVSNTLTEVFKDGVKAGTIKQAGSMWQAKGSYFEVVLSSIEMCKACFVPQVRIRTTQKENQLTFKI